MEKINKLKKKIKAAEVEGSDTAVIEKLKRKLAQKTSEVNEVKDGESSLIASLVASAQKKKKLKVDKEDVVNEKKKTKDKVVEKEEEDTQDHENDEGNEVLKDEDGNEISWTEHQVPGGKFTILLFYAYVRPSWTKQQHDHAITFTYQTLLKYGCTGRLRVAREGLNSTLSGPHEGIRNFTRDLRAYQPEHFGNIDFKYIDSLPENQMLKGLKVWPVSELVTYGFPPEASAPIEKGGTHLTPKEYHAAMTHKDAVMIDVRNYNESLIGKFAPPGTEVLDPYMRKSTEFPQWIDNNIDKLKGKKILMYCTGGIRCERASSYLVERGLEDVNQLEGGIHRYLESYVEDGGHWIGKNYTFDKRFCHGAKNAEVVSSCVVCQEPWERYQAQMKCIKCRMEVLVCRTCQRNKKEKPIDKASLICPLCKPDSNGVALAPPPKKQYTQKGPISKSTEGY